MINEENNHINDKILFPSRNSILLSDHGYNIVWKKNENRKFVDVEYSLDNGNSWVLITKNQLEGQAWRLSPMSFTGMYEGQFPIAWFITMMIIALIGGFGMGTAIDWYPEAQRIQSANTVRDASYSIWAGTALVLVRNSIWAAASIELALNIFPLEW